MRFKTYYPVLLISFLLSTNLFSQENISPQTDHQCGTTLVEDSNPNLQRQLDQRWQGERDYYLDIVRHIRNDLSRNIANVRMVPVQLHTIRTTAGTGGIADADYIAALALANEFFIKGGIYLYQCSAINYIDDDTYYDYNKTQKVALIVVQPGLSFVVSFFACLYAFYLPDSSPAVLADILASCAPGISLEADL